MDAQNKVVKFKLEEENEEFNGGKEKFLEKKGGSSFKKSGFFDLALTSFKEDSYFISDLRDSEKKALNEFKEKIESAIKSNQFLLDTAEEVTVKEDQKAATNKEVNAEKPTNRDAKNPDQNDGGTEKKSENGKSGAEGVQSHANDDISIWGIPLLHSKGDERTDVILLKFLRAKDFRVNDTFLMLQNCMAWRKKFGADKVIEEDLAFDENLDSVAFMHCCDKDGHPVCYNALAF